VTTATPQYKERQGPEYAHSEDSKTTILVNFIIGFPGLQSPLMLKIIVSSKFDFSADL